MKKFDPHSLPYIAATAQAVQIGHAGYILAGIPGAIIGGLVGACVSFSVAYASSQIASLNGQKREKWANTSMLGIMVLSPLLVTAPIYISFGEITFGWLRWITAGSWALAPDMSIFLAGLITGKGLVKQEEKQTESKPKKKSVNFVETKSEFVEQKTKQIEAKCKFDCGWSNEYATERGMTNGKNSHEGKCAKNPANQFAEMVKK